jgi:predicted Zn-dependent protease with MMP-like domain
MSADRNWTKAIAPSLEDFERMAAAAFAALPAEFRDLCENLVIRVEDFPDDDTLDDMGCETEFDLLGLFHGAGRAQSDAVPATGQFPNLIWLFRRPILDFWAGEDESLGAIITHVLVHEVGHHFGLSDEDMLRIEEAAE